MTSILPLAIPSILEGSMFSSLPFKAIVLAGLVLLAVSAVRAAASRSGRTARAGTSRGTTT